MLCTGCASTSGLPDGLGLFGVLSIVRLRSSQISQRALIERLELLLTAKVQHIVLDSTDLVRDLTVVDVRSRAEAAGVPRRDDEASARELPGGRQQLTGDGQAYLECNGLPPAIIEMLLPTLTTTYDRSTLLDADGPRYTIGVVLECIGQQRRRASAGEKLHPGDEVSQRRNATRPLAVVPGPSTGFHQQVLHRTRRGHPGNVGEQMEPHPPQPLRLATRGRGSGWVLGPHLTQLLRRRVDLVLSSASIGARRLRRGRLTQPLLEMKAQLFAGLVLTDQLAQRNFDG